MTRSLVKSQFFDLLDLNSSASPYTLKTCSGTVDTAGRKAGDIIVGSLDEKTKEKLLTLLECNYLPDDRSEILNPECTQYFPHLRPVADKIPLFDTSAPILLLLGRDILSLHKVREQASPYTQRLDLGWVIVGVLCLCGAHKAEEVNAYKCVSFKMDAPLSLSHARTTSIYRRGLKVGSSVVFKHCRTVRRPFMRCVGMVWGKVCLT